jgi:amino acid adenylation domain-containing protein
MTTEVGSSSPSPDSEKAAADHAPAARQGIADAGQTMSPSFAQARLWFFQQLYPGSSAYNMATALRLRGKLDRRTLASAFDDIIARHEVLHSRFVSIDGVPAQAVDEPRPVTLTSEGISCDSSASLADIVDRIVVEERKRPFDLAIGPLLRIRLLQLQNDDHVLILTNHHIVSDGWSNAIFMRELAHAYNCRSQGIPSALPKLPIQYSDFARWQRHSFEAGAVGSQLDYWKTKLAGLPPAIEVPADRPRPAHQSLRGDRVHFSVPPDVLAQVMSVSRGARATLFMTLMAAFDVLLFRYTGQTDCVIGTLIANRTQPNTDRLMGYFINMLPLRADLSGDPTFRDVVGQIRGTALDAYANQNVPFEAIVEAAQSGRDTSRHPLFQLVLVFQNTASEPLSLQGVDVSEIPIKRDTAHFDILLSITKCDDRLQGFVEYNTDLFERMTIERLSSHYCLLLGAATSTPDMRISEIPFMSGEERSQVLQLWNATDEPNPIDRVFPDLFARQVAATPTAVAVVCNQQQLTYSQLNARVKEMATRLRRLSIGQEQVVGVVAARGIDLLVGALAIMSVGATYLPIEPRYPANRVQAIVLQARPRCLIVADDQVERVDEALQSLPADIRPIRIAPSDAACAEVYPRNALATGTVFPANLAYVIFTSGSTGAPKGAAITHRGMVNHLFAKIRELELGPLDIIAQTASQCFDISIWQLVAALLVGGCVRIYADEQILDSAEFFNTLDNDGITIFQPVPSLLRALLEQTPRPSEIGFRNLRCVVPTGEELPRDLVVSWFKRFPTIDLVNAYGPTECSDDVTHHRMKEPPPPGRSIPIGRPIDNTQLYILDRHLQPVPIGIAGELFVGGVGVSRGYLGQPSLTAERFVPNPFQPGDRLYRTGDLVRWRNWGTIEFLGRIDHQVKIRGHRIELGEIEAVLKASLGVQDAVVVARPAPHGTKELVGYVSVQPEADIAGHEVRGWLGTKLPDYMVPAIIVVLPSLPLTANGKIDRNALPAPAFAQAAPPSRILPRTSAERTLARIWAEALNQSEIGIDENFFELGGHSLLVMRVIARAANVGVALKPGDFFARPTIRQMVDVQHRANSVRAISGTANTVSKVIAPPLVRLSDGSPETPLFIVHPISGHVGGYAELAARLAGSLSIIAFEARGLDGRMPPLSSISEIAEQLVNVVTEVQPEGPYRLAGWSFGALVAIEAARELLAAGKTVSRIVVFDPPAPSSRSDVQRPQRELVWQLFLRNYRQFGLTADTLGERFWLLGEPQRLHLIRERNPELSIETLEAWLEVLVANCEAWSAYQPSRLPFRLINVIPSDASFSNPASRTRWRELASEYDEHVAAGDHYTMFTSPWVHDLAILMQRLLLP